MLRQSKTWNGMISNLADTWTNFQKQIGDGGFFDSMKARLSSLMDYLGQKAKDGTLTRWANAISRGMTWAVDESINQIRRLADHFKFLTKWIKINPEIFDKIKTGLLAIAAVVFPKGAAILVLDDVLSFLEGKGSVIGDFAKSLSELSGIDTGPIGDVLTALAVGGAGLVLFSGTFGKAASGIKALGKALGLLGSAETAAGVGALTTLGGLSMSGGLLALAGSAAAAAGSIKLLWDAIQNDKGGLNGAIKDTVAKPLFDQLYDRFGSLLGVGPGTVDTTHAIPPEWQGPLHKPTPMSAKDRRKEQAPFQTQDIEAWKLEQQRKETEAARKAGTLNNGYWWDKKQPTAPASSPVLSDKIAMALSNMTAHQAKMGGATAVQTIVNDSSDRSVKVEANVALTVNQIAQAAAQAAVATSTAVASALKSVPIPPLRTTPAPSF